MIRMSMSFTITFHSGFRVGSSYGRDGVHQTAHARDLLPADSLKGLMRAEAARLLGESDRSREQDQALDDPSQQFVEERNALLCAVFGTSRAASSWAWTGAKVPVGAQVQRSLRHRVQIDPATMSAKPDHLVLGEQLWTPRAHFRVERIGFVDPDEALRHQALLKVSACAVHGLGAWRRRGLGWVDITCDAVDGPGVDEVTLRDLELALGAGPAPSGVGATVGEQD